MNDEIRKDYPVHIKWQFFLFLLVGGINTIFGYSVYALFIFLNIHYVVAVLASTILGVIFNFFTTGRIVFKNKKNIFFIKFALLYSALYILNILLIMLLNLTIPNLYINGAVASIALCPISFFVNKYYVFREII